jgi:outer membrane protein assembly factor BamE (lipoprotein component of BamABCDE complex)
MGTARRLFCLFTVMKILPLLATALAIAVSGCASYGGSSLRAGASTEGEVRSVMGVPALEFTGEDGARRLVYPRGPLGTQTFVVRLGQDGVLQEVKEILNDDTFNRIRPGLTQQDILHMIGPPGETMHFARSDTTAWDYRYVDTWGYTAVFSVTFDNKGIVVSKISRRIERNSRF